MPDDHERAITTITETLDGKVVSRTFKMYPAHFFDRENEVGERRQPVTETPDKPALPPVELPEIPLTAPLRVREYLCGLILAAVIKAGISILVMLGLIALTWSTPLGVSLLCGLGYVAVLIPFGWALGILGMSLVLRFGHGGEVLALVLPVIVQPLSCVFYPVSSLPVVAQWAARALPATWVFEDLRGDSASPSVALMLAFIESLVLVGVGAAVLTRTVSASRRSGRLARFAD